MTKLTSEKKESCQKLFCCLSSRTAEVEFELMFYLHCSYKNWLVLNWTQSTNYKESRAPCTKRHNFATQRSKFRLNAQNLTYVKSRWWQNKTKCQLTFQLLFFLAPNTLQSILWCMLTQMFLPLYQFLSESSASNKACPDINLPALHISTLRAEKTELN